VNVDTISLLEELLGLLQTMNETKGVPEGQNLSEKNILQTGNSDPNKKIKNTLSSNEQKKTREIATIFAKTFIEIQKKFTPDTALKTSVQKITPNVNRIVGSKIDKKETQKKGLLLGGLLLLLGGVGALIMGLITDGPFKGALKILSKIGISGGIKMLIAGAKALVKSIMAPFEIVQQLMTKGKFGKLISTAISDGVEMLVSGAKNLMSKFLKFVTAPFKTVGKSMGKGIFGKLFSALKPLFGILKKIPLIGSIISIGFAISRFMSGDNIGGVIDVLSALSGLLYLTGVGAPVAFAIGLGLDLLNAFLDAKTAGATDKNAAKMNILGDMAKSIGNWIWKNAFYLPVIGSFKRWGMAYDAFKGGNIMEGLKQFGLGIVSLIPGGGPLIMGIEALMGFGGSKEGEKDLKPNTSWFGNFKQWVKNKLKKLPSFLRKPLEWFGILDETSTPEATINASESGGLWEKITGWFSGLWKNIVPSMEGVGKWFSGLWDTVSKWFSGLLGKIQGFLSSDFMTGIIDNAKSIVTSVMSIIDSLFTILKNLINSVVDKIKNINIFGGKESDPNLETKAKQMGWNTVEEYKNSNWQKNTNKKKIEVVDDKRKQHVDDLVLIGREQIAILTDIRNIGMQTYKVLSNSSGSSASPIIISNSGGSKPKPSSQVSLNTNRGDYNSSPYAFA